MQLGRQLLLPERPGAIDQYRDHAHPALKRCLDFKAHIVVGVIESPAAFLIGECRPLTPDQGHQHGARVDGLPDDLGEVQARLNGVQIHEDARVRDTLAKLELQQTGVGGSVLTPVAEEDSPR